MSFDFNTVTSTCTCCHITEWSCSYDEDASKLQQLNIKLSYVNALIKGFHQYDTGHKLFMATLTESQLDDTDEDGDPQINKEILENTGWTESARGGVYEASDTHKKVRCREQKTGYLTIWTVHPPHFYECANAFKAEIEKQIADLKKSKEITAAIVAERQKFPELKIINLRKLDLVYDDTLLENVVRQKLKVQASTLLTHLKLKYGVDFQEVFGGLFESATFRQVKQYHADWRAGRK